MAPSATARPAKRPRRGQTTAPSGAQRDGAAVIVEAGIALMSERGYNATSIRAIAKRAKMSTANLYHHFSSKQALLMHIVDDGIVRLRHDTDEALEAADGVLEELEAVIRAHVVAHAERRSISFLTTTELRNLPAAERRHIRQLIDEQQSCFDAVIEKGVSEGVFATAYPHDASRAVGSMCTSVASWFNPKGDLSPDLVADRYVCFARSLLGAPVAERDG
jgi:AcrR family transcriptional regulator